MCFGQSTGSISSVVAGGTPAYTYSWSNNKTTQNETNIAVGTYTLTVTDSKACTSTSTASITSPAAIAVNPGFTATSCFGSNDGTAFAAPTGGTPGYTYSWSTGVTAATTTGLSPAVYIVTVTDASACTQTSSVTITSPTAILPHTGATAALCFGGSTGTAFSVPTGGTSPYTYAWSSGAVAATATTLAAGTYTVTVTDKNACTGTSTAIVTQPASALTATTSTTPISCNGGSNGTATAVGAGGTTAYTYSWNTGGSTATITALAANTYTVTVTDKNACTATSTATIVNPAAINITLTPTNVICPGTLSGSINTSVAGGAPAYTYSWSNNKTTQNLTNLAAGTYKLTVTDSKGCSKVDSVSITTPTAIFTHMGITAISCSGKTDGTAFSAPSGGTSPYIFTWSNGATASTITALAAGSYTVTVTDAHACTASAFVLLSSPAAVVPNATETDVTCNPGAANGSATCLPAGGFTPYTYSWSSGAATQTINNIAAATYTLSVTDAHGCQATQSVVVKQPAAMVLTMASTHTSCSGCNGTATITVAGGNGGNAYSWSNGKATPSVNRLCAQTYSLTVTDSKGCSSTSTVAITYPYTITASIVPKNVSCNGACNGKASASAAGGVSHYTYSWSNGSAISNPSLLCAGGYTVSVTDANSCTTKDSVTITQPLILSTTATGTNISCPGKNDGTAKAIPTGGTVPYTYAWSSGAILSSLANLSANTYTVTVTDANGCTATSSVTITQPNPIVDNAVITGTGCHSASATISLTPTGGSGVYTYKWNTGPTTSLLAGLGAGSYSVTISDGGACPANFSYLISSVGGPVLAKSRTATTCHGQCTGIASVTATGDAPFTYAWSTGATASTITNLCANAYTITVTDNAGCITVDSIGIKQPNLLFATPTLTNVTCNGLSNGAIALIPAGGTPNYTYSWSNTKTTSSITTLSAGTYTVTLTDKNGCDTLQNFTITQPQALSASTAPTNVTCHGLTNGSILATPTGGTPNYTYSWSNAGAAANVNNLAAGIYTVTLTDANACTATNTATITQPGAIVITTVASNTSCNGGSDGAVKATPSGGTGAYTYNWFSVPIGSTNSTVGNLTAGGYTITVTDANGCTSIDSARIQQPAAVKIVTALTDPACGQSNGSISTTVSGGTLGYTYSWSTGALTATLNGLPANNYTLTVTDSKGCTSSNVSILTQLGGVSAIISTTNPTCKAPAGGSVTAIPSAGTAPYSYQWTVGGTGQTVTGLGAGTYTVTVTDKNGCTVSSNATLVAPIPITITVATTDANCSLANGKAVATVSGGNPVYTYSWNTGKTIDSIAAVAAGNYTLTVTDALGCTNSSVIAINNAGGPTGANISPLIGVNCQGACTGSATVNPIGGTAPYTYSWTDIVNNQNQRSNMCQGTYTLAITDKNACLYNAVVNITVPAAFAFNPTITNASCSGKCDGSVSIASSGGNPPYTYTWSNGAIGATQNSMCAGTYSVTLTDAAACTTVTTVVINPGRTITPTLSSTNINCFGKCSGTALAGASGGTAPYTYSWTNGASASNLTNLCAGAYTVSVTDAAGCQATSSTLISAPTAITSNPNVNNTLCGVCNGQIAVVPSGGNPTYTYSWSNGSSSSTINNLCASTYTLTITDASACTNSFVIPVSNTNGPSASVVSTTPTTCFGGANGTATVVPHGGTAPYTYSWSASPSTLSSINGLSAGTTFVQITDANGCKQLDSAVISSPAQISITPIIQSPTCGHNNGSAKVTSTGGTGAYTYSWSSGQTVDSISAVGSGSYTVTVTDANACSASQTILLNSNGGPVLTFTSQDATCNGSCNGASTVNINGGTSPYIIHWSTNATTNTINNLCAGTYTCAVVDANLCANLATVTINQPQALTEVTTMVQPLCNAVCNGSIGIAPAGGTIPYTYLWSDGTSASSLSNICQGTYSLTITDNNNCAINPVFTLNNAPNPFTITPTVVKASCGQCNGQMSVQVIGGSTPYQYLWSNTQTTDTIKNLCSAIYDVQITDANGCSASQSIPLGNTGGPSSSGKTVTNINCFGSCTGSANLNPQGGTAPYTYNWSNGVTLNRISNACAGTYTVEVSDALGCNLIDTVNISQPQQLVGNPSVTQPTSCGSSDGAIALSPTGGTSPYTYSWSNGTTGSGLNNLAGGSYTVTITDATACTASTAIAVNSTSGPSISSLTSTPASCNSQCNGTATVVASGGTQPYTYLWNDGPKSTTSVVSNLCAGTYIAQVTDQAGCVITGTVNITQPLALFISSPNVTDVTCNKVCNGTASISAGGGTLPYTYSWNTGATTPSITNLCIGSYTVTVTDGNNCSTIQVATIGVTPNPFTITPTVVKASCGQCNGQMSVQVIGGSTPYQYLWSNTQTTDTIKNLCSAIYDVQITDANGCSASQSIPLGNTGGPSSSGKTVTNINCFGSCTGSANLNPQGGTAPYTYNWSNGVTLNRISNACAGTYTVEVSDALGCNLIDTVNISQPQQLVGNPSVTQPTSCGSSDGAIALSPTGGTSPYTYSWSNGTTGSGLNNLAGGSYTVTITDATACTASTAIAVNSTSGPSISSLTSTPASCNSQCNGTATVVASGGTQPYTYLWNDGPKSTTSVVSNLCAGTYIAQVTDQAGCVITGTVNITQPLALFISSPNVTDVTCNKVCNGTASISAGGGTLPYTYSWNTGATTPSITNLCIGSYTVTVTDGNNCSTIQVATIGVTPNPFTITPTVVKASCGQCNGQMSVQVIGGSTPYQYLWSNTQTTDTIKNLCSAIYDVQITDANGCSASQSIPLGNTGGPSSSGKTVTNINCFGSCTGSANLNPQGGTAPYTYNWSNGVTLNRISNACAGTYTVEVSDALGCNLIDTVNISQPAAFAANPSFTSPTKCGLNDGSINLSTTGGTQPYTYSWSGAYPATGSLNNLPAGAYTVTITDANACSLSQTVLLNNVNGPVIDSIQSKGLSCAGICNGSATVYVSKGLPGYTYLWSNPGAAVTAQVTGLCASVYTIQVTDAQSCFVSSTVTISQPSPITLSNPTLVNITCPKAANGQIQVLANGGSLPYNYSWSNGATTPTNSNLTAGAYVLTVTDVNACAIIDTISIKDPNPIIISNHILQPSCHNTQDGSITLTLTGGTGSYTYSWSGPGIVANATATLQNLKTGQYIVTVLDSNACNLNDTINLTAANNAIVKANAGKDTVACNGSSVTLNGNASTGATNFTWYNASNNSVLGNTSILNLTPAVGINNYYLVADSGKCGDTAHVQVTIMPDPTLNISATQTTLVGSAAVLGSVPLTNAIGAKYHWSPGGSLNDSTASNPTASPKSSTIYTITVTDKNGCTATGTTSLKVDPALQVDNGVTPNGDGKNDVMFITGIERYPQAVVEIYNRWGELVYTSPPGYTVPWNGKYHNSEDLPVGTYYYVIRLFLGDPSNVVSGPVTIIR